MSDFESKTADLKQARDKMLGFHKLLIDHERSEIERVAGKITAGQFLNLLMNDDRFEWLRTISKLVVRIDEAFELSDGFPPELLDKLWNEFSGMFDDSESNSAFKILVTERMEILPEAEVIRQELRLLIK